MKKNFPGDSGLYIARDFFWMFNAGGTAAVIAGIIQHPQDVIKTTQQAHIGPKSLTFIGATRKIMGQGGFKRVLRGMGPNLTRAYCVNVIRLPFFDKLKDIFIENGTKE